jgi:hypothetical protein
MLERPRPKALGGGGREHPLKLGPEAGSLLAPALLRWNDLSEMAWLARWWLRSPTGPQPLSRDGNFGRL